MQISICIQAEVDEHATSFYDAPIEDVTDGRVWLLVNYDDCMWDYELVDDFIDGEQGGVPFSQPIQTLGDCEGFLRAIASLTQKTAYLTIWGSYDI